MINISFAFLIYLYISTSVLAKDSSIFVDWSRNIDYPHQVRQFTVDYTPAIGYPSSHSVFPTSTQSLAINGTAPAVEYLVNVSALLTDNRKVPILSTILTSSPSKPELEFLRVGIDDLTYALLLPQIENPNLSYYVILLQMDGQDEYFDLDHASNVNYIETNKTALRIRQLEPNTRYKLQIFAVYRGIPSTEPLEKEFKTKASSEQTTQRLIQNPIKTSSNEELGNFTDSSQVSQSTIHRKPIKPFALQTSGNYVTATVTMLPLPSSITPERPFYTNDTNHVPLPHWKQPENFNHTRNSHLPELPQLELIGQIAASLLTTQSPIATELPTQTMMSRNTTPIHQKSTKSTRIVNLSKSLRSTTTTQKPVENTSVHRIVEEIDVNEMPATTDELPTPTDFTDSHQSEHQSFNQQINELQDPESTRISTTIASRLSDGNSTDDLAEELESFGDNKVEIRATKEDNQIKLEWDQPEKTICDNYLVNTTLVDSHKSFSTASENLYTYIKFYNDEQVKIGISCLSEGVVSTLWSAEKFLDLRKPKPVDNLRMKQTFTDESYVASITLDIDWPLNYNSDQYEIVVVWALGKKAIGTNKAVFNEKGEMTIGKLEAAKLYTFAVRNVSKELEIASAPMGIRQITPPVITSTVYPGQISSYAININFGDSEREYPFDTYELIFAGNARNITKKLAKSDPKSFTFNKLIPGKTYTFVLYTVYKNIKSRPVIEEITTYPLKVKSFNPVIGPGYVTLYWEIENVADNDCKFRLAYASTLENGILKEQKVELQDTNKYRFSGLQYDTYYTFTITVLMGKGKAQAESESEMLTVGFNGKPLSLPLLKRHGSRELQLTFENDPHIFSDTNGVVDNFAVIVSENIKLGGDDYELKSYYEIKDESKWPAYRASHSNYSPFKKRGSSRSAVFLIGDEDCDRRKLSEPYCNGVLKSHVDYYVKVRAYLVTNFAIETEWVSVKGLVDEDPQEKGHRRLPCFMYLNGCSSSANVLSSSISLLFAIGSLLSYYLFFF